MTALEPADVLVAALQAGAHSIKLMHLWPGWWMKIAEEDIACKTESLCNFFLEVARFGKLLGINIFDYEVCIDVPDKEIPFFSLRKALLGEPAMRYCFKS